MIDVVIPVYNEGDGILSCLNSLFEHVTSDIRILICYDHDHDSTLVSIREKFSHPLKIEYVKNTGAGVHGAVMTGLFYSSSPASIVMPADDDFNAHIIDPMIQQFQQGMDIVCPSRFMAGGKMVGCPFIKKVFVRTAAFFLFYCAGLPTHDPTNGFRLFSRRVITEIPIESTMGFTFSLEYLVKAHARAMKISEIPAVWFEKDRRVSRFRVFAWLPGYLKWFFFAFKHQFLGGQA